MLFCYISDRHCTHGVSHRHLQDLTFLYLANCPVPNLSRSFNWPVPHLSRSSPAPFLICPSPVPPFPIPHLSRSSPVPSLICPSPSPAGCTVPRLSVPRRQPAGAEGAPRVPGRQVRYQAGRNAAATRPLCHGETACTNGMILATPSGGVVPSNTRSSCGHASDWTSIRCSDVTARMHVFTTLFPGNYFLFVIRIRTATLQVIEDAARGNTYLS